MRKEQFFTFRDDVQEVIFRWSAVANMALSGAIITVYLHNHYRTDINFAPSGTRYPSPEYDEASKKADAAYRSMVRAWKEAMR